MEQKMLTAEERKEFRAYYYTLNGTGSDAVDAILAAVASAGRMFHHTNDWGDDNEFGPSPASQIQQAANEAAAALSSRDKRVEELEHFRDFALRHTFPERARASGYDAVYSMLKHHPAAKEAAPPQQGQHHTGEDNG